MLMLTLEALLSLFQRRGGVQPYESTFGQQTSNGASGWCSLFYLVLRNCPITQNGAGYHS